MALIKCPECGQTVLSVASLCPHCSHRLGAESGQSAEVNDLAHCRHCDELMTRRAKVCPHCGLKQHGKGPIVAVGLSVVIVLVLGTWIMMASSTGGESALPIVVAPPTPPAVSVPVQASVDSAVALDPGHDSAAGPSVVTVSRIAQEWANVRTGRNLSAEIIAILRPGQEVAVADRRGGWWSVYLGDSLVGFVSSNLLDTILPQPGLP
jgi:Bacterial SH3 domain/Double zinc ribbon